MKNLAPYIDHTLLNLEATDAQIEKLCAEAREFHFATVCVYPRHIPLSKKLLENSGVKPIAVVGFPTGRETTEQKVSETNDAIQKGALEIDMVMNVDFLKARKLRSVYRDIRAVVLAAKPIPVKVILETCLLDHEEKISACALAKAAGAAFVKTSTGFSKSGATVDDIALMRRTVGPKMGVKASGGVRTREAALAMIAAGATRIGTSSGVSIVSGGSAGPNSVY
jgi:deoxyribose-phosphate aldolase